MCLLLQTRLGAQSLAALLGEGPGTGVLGPLFAPIIPVVPPIDGQ